ncbi:hypothetical protein BBK36DRAFT_1162182 [Trichoderma citrinoviride]|uniref:Uncharacterized protein n=1 Tax=Trichoderma citrinoviride TaxID=58853 RepID=A0A2T4B2B8_9HYPO|nr:hypothetical protein BBK36DRAFT_1162182 [Trichoderma citrinoviride]PTB63473.1 hypothetical protein BBK36DRAFT_1162182 [Trichoderma citrinoviride]
MANNTNSMNTSTSHQANPTASSSTTTANPSSTTTPSLRFPPPSYHSQTLVRNPLPPALTTIHTSGTIVLPYDDNTTYQPTTRSPKRPNIVRESLTACVEYCCLPRVPPPSEWSSDYSSSTPYPSSLSSYTTDSYRRTESSMRSRDRMSDAEPVQAENVSKKDLGYAKQERMSSTKEAGSESSSWQCCRRCSDTPFAIS